MLEFFIFAIVMVKFIGFSFYLLLSFSLFKMARNKGLRYSWLAFFPFFHLLVLGNITEEIRIFNIRIAKPGNTVMFLALLIWAISCLAQWDLLIWVLVVIEFLIYVCIIDKIFWMYKEHYYNLSTILSIFFPFMLPIFLFPIRNNRPIRK